MQRVTGKPNQRKRMCFSHSPEDADCAIYTHLLLQSKKTPGICITQSDHKFFIHCLGPLCLRLQWKICENQNLGQQCLIRLLIRFWKMKCLDITEDKWGSPKVEKYLSLLLGQPLSHLVSFAIDVSSNWRDEGEWWEEKTELFVKQENLSWCLGHSRVHTGWGELLTVCPSFFPSGASGGSVWMATV